MVRKKGVFITFEGPEGGGKSTQMRRFVSFLKKRKRRTLVLREPGGTQVSEAIRKIILNKKFEKMCPETELMLYLAARAQIVREKIQPALQKGMIVVCDRFEDSTLAYQGFGRNMNRKEIEAVSQRWVRGKLQPHLTILLDIHPKRGMMRGGRSDRMENQTFAFHRRVRREFLTLAKRNRRRYVVIDASRTRDEVFEQILKRSRRVV